MEYPDVQDIESLISLICPNNKCGYKFGLKIACDNNKLKSHINLPHLSRIGII